MKSIAIKGNQPISQNAKTVKPYKAKRDRPRNESDVLEDNKIDLMLKEILQEEQKLKDESQLWNEPSSHSFINFDSQKEDIGMYTMAAQPKRIKVQDQNEDWF